MFDYTLNFVVKKVDRLKKLKIVSNTGKDKAYIASNFMVQVIHCSHAGNYPIIQHEKWNKSEPVLEFSEDTQIKTTHKNLWKFFNSLLTTVL